MRRIGLAALLLCCSQVALADVIYMTDGTQRVGKVLRRTDDAIEVEFSLGDASMSVRIPADKIDRIELGQTENEVTMSAYQTMRGALEPDDAEGWYRLALWCEKQRYLKKEAQAAFEKVIQIDSDHKGAREKLGYRRYLGEWMTEAKMMSAKGMVQHDGEWITQYALEELRSVEVQQRLKEAERRTAEAEKRATEAETENAELRERLAKLEGRMEELEKQKAEPKVIKEKVIRQFFPFGGHLFKVLYVPGWPGGQRTPPEKDGQPGSPDREKDGDDSTVVPKYEVAGGIPTEDGI